MNFKITQFGKELDKSKYIGVISLMGEYAHIVHIGMTVFNNEKLLTRVNEWNVDVEVEKEIVNQLTGYGYKKIVSLSRFRSDIYKKYFHQKNIGRLDLDNGITEYLIKESRKIGLAELFIVARRSGNINGTPVRFTGYGFHDKAYTFLFGSFYSHFVLIDIDKRKVVKDGSLFAVLPMKGTRRLFKEEKTGILNFVSEEEFKSSVKEEYREIIFDSNFDVKKRKELHSVYKDYNYSDEYYEDKETILEQKIYPIAVDAMSYNKLTTAEKNKLDDFMQLVQKAAMSQIPERLNYISLAEEEEEGF